MVRNNAHLRYKFKKSECFTLKFYEWRLTETVTYYILKTPEQ